MPDTPATTNTNENNAEKLARLLELELMQKRTVWKQAAAHYRTIRLFGFFSFSSSSLHAQAVFSLSFRA